MPHARAHRGIGDAVGFGELDPGFRGLSLGIEQPEIDDILADRCHVCGLKEGAGVDPEVRSTAPPCSKACPCNSRSLDGLVSCDACLGDGRVRAFAGEQGVERASDPARTLAFQSRSEEPTSELQSLMRISYAV